MDSPSAPERYADDAPIERAADDRFGRWPFARRIADVLATRADTSSLVVGIYGPWGDGKTSVLNLMAGVLAQADSVTVARFNPWQFDDDQRLVRAFFEVLAGSIENAGSTGEVASLLRQYGQTLASDSYEALPIGAVSGAQKLSLDALRTRIDTSLVDSGRRTIVLVDDIDRVGPVAIHTLLRLVNLSASFKTVAYVLALDAEVVASALGERYGDNGSDAGRQFLEKIIQIPLHLPDAESADLQAACLEGIDSVMAANAIELANADAEELVRHLTDGLVPALHTPRQVKRYLNAIRFAVPMLKGEVHVLDQLIIEAIRAVYPGVYLAVRDNQDAFTGQRLLQAPDGGVDNERTAAAVVVESGLAGLTESQRQGALSLLKTLFPRLNAVFGHTIYGAEWNHIWDAERRIASPDCFRRYFQYALPTGEIGDGAVASMLDACNHGRSTEIEAFFDTLGKRSAWVTGMRKLTARMFELTDAGRTVLVGALSAHAVDIPSERGRLAAIASPGRVAVLLASRVVGAVTIAETRRAAALMLMRDPTPLPFAIACFELFERTAAPGTDRILDDAQLQAAGTALAARVADAASHAAMDELGERRSALLAHLRAFSQ